MHRTPFILLALVSVVATITGTAMGTEKGEKAGAVPLGGASQVESDFNGDGFSDLAVGVTGEDLSGVEEAGVVQVFYGDATGVTVQDQIWSQEADIGGPILGTAEIDDYFGASLTSGDFDGDDYADLAVGVPRESLSAETTRAGLVHVIFGSADGLTGARDQILAQNGQLQGINIKGTPQANDVFGTSLASGDLGHGSFDDLIVGVPGESVGTKDGAGAVHVFYGSSEGIAGAGNQLWHRDMTRNGIKVKGTAGANDLFGTAVDVGNFGNGEQDDLAIGASADNVAGQVDAGSVNVLYGSENGVRVKGNQFWHQNRPDINDAAETDNYFGDSMASANFGRSGHADLAIGVLGEDISGEQLAGAVHIIYGSPQGLTSTNDQLWHQDSEVGDESIAEEAGAQESFGSSLAAAKFGSSSEADLAIGASNEGIGDIEAAGVVHVLFGGNNGIRAADDQLFSQDTGGIEDTAEEFDLFGARLGAADFNGDGQSDLSVGVFPESVGSAPRAGVVHTIYGAPSGLSTGGNELWHQDVPDVMGGAEENDTFGISLIAP